MKEDIAVSGGKRPWLIRALSPLLCALIYGLLVYGAAIYYHLDMAVAVRNLLVTVFGTVITVYVYNDARIRGRLFFDNEDHPLRFYGLFAIFALAGLFLPMVNSMIWPFICVFVILSLCSERLPGIIGSTVLLMTGVHLTADASSGVFFMYLMAGLVSALLICGASESLSFGWPLMASLMILLVMLSAYHLLFLNQTFGMNMLAAPLINAGISLVLLLIMLNFYGVYVVRGKSDAYMEINDPEYGILVKLRKEDPASYYRAVHTAYLAEKCAEGLELDIGAVKCCAYYHEQLDPEIAAAASAKAPAIASSKGLAETAKKAYSAAGEDADEEIRALALKMPREARQLINEYRNGGKNSPVSKEATLVSLCEDLVRRITEIYSLNSKAKPDTDRLIDDLVEKKEIYGNLKDSRISMAEIGIIKTLLKKEKQYYDLLR
ncbi:hypothetical protein [Butyrivibrio sp. MC2013]|uniref:hypothetical protein n=1 Tax=Butyrivibrio sp. MC2013 TaxID=1280686 RepID=UPI0004189045|nr:hypothetical protein [Butyrivibrio sp. MC2013]